MWNPSLNLQILARYCKHTSVCSYNDQTSVITKQQSWARGCSRRCCQFAPHRTGLVGIAHVEILRDPVPTRPLQPAKRAHNCGRGRVVAVTPLAKTSYAIGMAYRCVCMLENTHVMRTHTNTRIGNCQIFFFFNFQTGFANDNSKQTRLLFTVAIRVL